jgi:hypothetical protein
MGKAFVYLWWFAICAHPNSKIPLFTAPIRALTADDAQKRLTTGKLGSKWVLSGPFLSEAETYDEMRLHWRHEEHRRNELILPPTGRINK